MVIFSNCKINVGLHIVAKRANGYHNLETFFFPIPFYDVIELIQAPHFQFTTSGLPIDGAVENNLCIKTYNLLKNEYPQLPNVHIHLQKNIPMGAGIGGGSANAAHTLLLFNKKFNLDIPFSILQYYAAQLGSDCSFFIHNKAGFEIETGDNNTYSKTFIPHEINFTGYTIVLVFPTEKINTKDAFANVAPKPPTTDIKNALYSDIDMWKNTLVNDFEASIFEKLPQLNNYKNTLYTLGATYASMSGSGSTIYGIFKNTQFNEALLPTALTIPYKVFKM